MIEGEIVDNGKNGSTLRISRAAIEEAIGLAAFRGQVEDLARKVSDNPGSARVRLGMDAAARDGVAAAIAASTAATERMAAGLEALVKAIAGLQVQIVVAPTPITFAPNVQPAVLEARLTVDANVKLPEPRKRTGKAIGPDGVEYTVAVD